MGHTQKQRVWVSEVKAACSFFADLFYLYMYSFKVNTTWFTSNSFVLKALKQDRSLQIFPHAALTESLLRNSQKRELVEVGKWYNPNLSQRKGAPQEMPWPEEGHLQHSAHRAGSSPWWRPRWQSAIAPRASSAAERLTPSWCFSGLETLPKLLLFHGTHHPSQGISEML